LEIKVNKNKTSAESVVSETYPATVRYNLLNFFKSGTWVLSTNKEHPTNDNQHTTNDTQHKKKVHRRNHNLEHQYFGTLYNPQPTTHKIPDKRRCKVGKIGLENLMFLNNENTQLTIYKGGKMKKRITFLCTLFLVFLIAAFAQATPVLRLTSGADTATIIDGDADGIVYFNGALGGSVWTVNVTTGITKPAIGTANEPKLDLNSVNVSGGGAGTLTILFSDNNFAAPTIGMWNTAIGGTTNGTLSVSSYYDNGNAELATTTSISSLGPFGPGAFSGNSDSESLTVAGPFSLTLEVNITHTDEGQTTSFDCILSTNGLPVYLDIKPGSCPNPLNVKSKGVLPVAILGTEKFDVYTIDIASVRLTLNGNGDGVPALRSAYEDVATPFEGELCDCHDYNGDGYEDLILKFDTPDLVDMLGLDSYSGDITLTVKGNLFEEFGGTPIIGQDCIRIK